MCATLSDSFRNIDNISKSLNTPLMNSSLRDLKLTANALTASALPYLNENVFKSLTNSITTPYINQLKATANTSKAIRAMQGAAVAAVAIPNLNNLTAASNSLSKSIASTLSPIDLNFSPKMSAQIFGDALTTMRYFSTSNNHINLQWKNLINTELSVDLIDSFMNLTNATKLSASLGISEDQLRFMQKAIDSSNEIDDDYTPTERNGDIPEDSSSNKHLQNNQQQTNEIKSEKYQNVSPKFLVWLFIFFVPVLLYVDGNIRNNKLEQQISMGIEMTINAVKSATEQSDNKK